MANVGIVKKLLGLSPHIEVLVRKIYWKNIGVFSKVVKKRKPKKKTEMLKSVNFNKIVSFLSESGVNSGSLLLVHSAYGPLKGTGMSPNGILDELINLVGEAGTLAMPAMPKFKNAQSPMDYLQEESADVVYEYDVKKSPVTTGVLPLMLHKRAGSIRSRHPINSMVALGSAAQELMEDNLEGNSPLACGVNSTWHKCVENNAFIVGLGTDLTHSLTAIHVAEDILDEKWPIKSWYREKYFDITDGDYREKRLLRERCPKWGALHFGERTLCKDLIESGIMKSVLIDGVVIEILKSKELIQYLNSRNENGYPYFGINKSNRL